MLIVWEAEAGGLLLGYLVGSRAAWATRDPVSREKKKKEAVQEFKVILGCIEFEACLGYMRP